MLSIYSVTNQFICKIPYDEKPISKSYHGNLLLYVCLESRQDQEDLPRGVGTCMVGQRFSFCKELLLPTTGFMKRPGRCVVYSPAFFMKFELVAPQKSLNSKVQ